MSIFGNMFTSPALAGSPPSNSGENQGTPAGQPLSGQPQNPGNPGGPGQQAQPQSHQQQSNPGQQQQAPAGQPQPAAPPSLSDILQLTNPVVPGQQASQQGQEGNESAVVAQALQALLAGNENHTQTDAMPGVNVDRLAQHLAQHDFTGNADFGQLLGMQLTDEQHSGLRTAMNQMQMQTIATVVPVINAAVQAAVQTAEQRATRTSMTDQTTQQIMTAFRAQVPYADSPAIAPLVATLAQNIAASAPRGTSPERAAVVMQGLLQQLGQALAVPQNGPGRAPGTHDMSNIFEG